MRNLQRIRHQRAPNPRAAVRIERAEQMVISKKTRRIGWVRLRRFVTLALVVWGAAHLYLRFKPETSTADAVIAADVVEVVAPVVMRVEEVFIDSGATCERGDSLLRLAAIDSSSLDVARQEVERARLRLGVAARGGEIALPDLGRRQERVSDAELELSAAEEALTLAKGRLATAELRRHSISLTLDEERLGLTARRVQLEGELEVVHAERNDLQAALRLADLDAANAKRLHDEGLISLRDRKLAEAALEQAQRALTAANERSVSLGSELQVHAERLVVRDERADLERLDAQAQVRSARSEVSSAAARVERWGGVRDARDSLLPKGAADGVELRDMELELLRAELATAEAKLRAEEQRLGVGIVRAEADGVVDRLEARPGAIVEAGAVLLTYFDPRSLRIEAFVEPDEETTARTAQRCVVLVAGESESFVGRIERIGSSLVPLPDRLATRPSLRDRVYLPVDVQLDTWPVSLRPNRRVRVHFEHAGKDGQWVAAMGRGARED